MMDTKELIKKLNFRAQVSFDANKDAGRSGIDWAIENEIDWAAARRLTEQQQVIEELVVALDASREANEVGHENPQRLYRVIDRALFRAKEHIDALDK